MTNLNANPFSRFAAAAACVTTVALSSGLLALFAAQAPTIA